MTGGILIVDDEPRMASAVREALASTGARCVAHTDAAAAFEALLADGADVLVCDWRMPGLDGLELLRRVRDARPGTRVILMTAYGDVPSAVEAMRSGAFDYLTKPFDNEELRRRVSRALELARLERENRQMRQALAGRYADAFIAASPAMRGVLELVDRAAATRAPVLVLGESGSGKELVARRLHFASARVAGPFVALNCKALAESVLESELFGHERGAFTGATAEHAGCFERADSGTLFLDEIGEVSEAFQAKLLRVLQDGEVLRVGGSRPRRVDVRVVAATNRDPAAEVAAGRFREDLFYRLNVIPVRLPPLRERRDDILPLARHFLSQLARESGRPLRLDAAAERRLLEHTWPGNARELRNVLERAAVLARDEELGYEDLLLDPAPRGAAPSTPGTLQDHLERAAREGIRTALDATGGRRAEAAARLGVDRATLYRWMRRLGLRARS
jgi:two-component system response regulator HydG